MPNRRPQPLPSSVIAYVTPSLLFGGMTIGALVAGAPFAINVFLCAATALIGPGLLYRYARKAAAKLNDSIPVPPAVSTALFAPPPQAQPADAGLLHLERNAAVDRLIAIVAKDIDQQHETLSASLQNLEKHLANQPLLGRKLRPIRLALERATMFKTRLLAFSDQTLWMPERIDTTKLIDSACGLLRNAMLSDATPLKCSIDDTLWPIDADLDQMLTALLHLAGNARDAMPRGGAITLGAQNVTLNGTPANLFGDYVAITVADHGAGIAPEHLDQIFLPFFTTKALHNGTGLGLGQVRTTALHAGGDVTVSSIPSIGTTVTLHIPRATSFGRNNAHDSNGDERVSRLDILIAKTNEAEVAELVRIATVAGYRVQTTTRALDACAIIRRARPRLVITDTSMRGIIENISLGRYLLHAHPEQLVVLTATAFSVSEAESFPILPNPPTREGLAAFLGQPRTADAGTPLEEIVAK